MKKLKKFYPLKFKTSYFKQYEEQESQNLKYVIYTTVNNDKEENSFFEDICHESNLKIETIN